MFIAVDQKVKMATILRFHSRLMQNVFALVQGKAKPQIPDDSLQPISVGPGAV
jgi:hypothetical protein